jgi:uncharacterized membrane protein
MEDPPMNNAWMFMVVMVIIIPLIMIIMGKSFIKKPPSKINHFFGYRTKMSMKNMDTWTFAHQYYGNLCWKAGVIMLPLSLIPMIFLFGQNDDILSIAVTVIMLIQAGGVIAPAIPTEKTLKETFNKNGSRKNI